MRMAGTFWMKTLAPSTLASLGPSSRTTWSAGFLCLKGFRVMVMRPTLSDGEEPLAPTNAIAASTLGSWLMMLATWRCSTFIASNEMSCGPSTKQKSCPESSLGRKPFGARENSTAVDADPEERDDHDAS